jgi:hypothetical protein
MSQRGPKFCFHRRFSLSLPGVKYAHTKSGEIEIDMLYSFHLVIDDTLVSSGSCTPMTDQVSCVVIRKY